MTAITEANAKKIIKSLPFFRQMSKHGKEGWYKFLTNFDDTTGAYAGAFTATDLTGTTQASFTLDSDNTADVKLKLATNTSADGNYTLTIQAATATWTANRTLSLPDPGASDSFVYAALAQTLTNKTLTTPVIASFVNATHTHADAANGGAITASASLAGTTGSIFTVNYGGTTPEIAIGGGAGTGNYTISLISPTLAGTATITLPAVTGTLAILGANTFTAAQTIGTGASIAGSGTGSFDMSGASGVFTTSTGTNTLSGNVAISGSKTFTTGTGAVALNGNVTIAATKTLTFAQGAGASIIMNGETSGGITISPAAVGTSVLTLVNPVCAAPATITMPNATATLATLGLNETFSGNKVITGTLDIRGNVSASASNPNFDLSGSSGTFLSPTGPITLGTGAVTVSGSSLIIGNATTPVLTIQSGKTNTGYIEVKGKTSGMLKITAADATAQTITLSTAAQTSGAATVTIPDLAGASQTISFIGKDETLSGAKTFSGGVLASGANNNDFSGGTGIFKTSTGIVTIGAAPSIAGTAAGPAVAITGGAGGGTSGTGGAVTILGGAGTAGDANGGAVIIRGGAKNGAGTDGAITIGDSNTASITLGKMPRIPTATKAANLAIQATATALAEGFNLVTCADASNVAVLLPVPVAGMQVIVKNGSAQTAKVFPSSGKVINALAGDASYDMATVKAAMFIAYDTTTWYTVPLAAS